MDLNKSLLNLNSEIIPESSKDETSNIWSEINESFLLDLEEAFDPENENTSLLRNDEQYKGFDNNAGGQYIYPINLPIRTYQYNIIKAALFKNTLIVLPTGLGKTFIAAVVMYNIYRWYPTGKVIFMAPTRPLVNQQIEACRKIMGIPIDDTAEMTGKQNKDKRTELWHNKRIFFATPQVVQIDINDPDLNFPFNSIKLIVVDEAHKAKGRYAYTDVIQTINNRNPYFRVIALSATPGRRIEDVMEILQNLCISHIEVRCENSIDVQPFIFRKNIKIVLVPLGEQITRIRDELINIIDPFVRNLIDNGVLNGNTGNFTKYWIVMEHKRFKEISINQRHPKHSAVSTDFSICISLYHALELLERHGLRVFLNFFDDPDPDNQKEKFFVQSNPKLKNFLNNLRKEIGPNPFAINDQTMTNGKIQTIPDNLDFGHPKFEMVKKFLVEHFQEHKTSKVIVFCEFRESVMLLHRLLLQNRPLILPKVFVGQGGTGSIRAVSQKEQMQVMNDFRNGIVNTLIATSVAEEGIDVGEVNLIICFDISSKNPTRFVQRIGRTGRKQQGKVILLATEGKEHCLVKEVLATRNKVNEKLSKSRAINNILYQRSPRIVPPEFNPKCLEVFMKDQNEVSMDKNEKKTKNGKKIKKKDIDNIKSPRRRKLKENGPPSQDVRNFFKKIEIPNEEEEIFCSPEKETNNIIPDDDLINVDNMINIFSPVTQFEKLNTSKLVEESSQPVECLRQISNGTNNNIELNFRKLNHLARNIDKKQNFPNYSNIMETLLSKKVHKDVKKFILQNNIEFVQDKFDAMLIIWAVNNDDMDNLSGVDNSEKQIRTIYSCIEEVLGDKYSIENFLKKNSDKYLNKINEIKDIDEKFSDFFEEFDERDFTDSVQGFIEQKLSEIDLHLLEPEEEQFKAFTKHNVNSSINYESLLDTDMNTSKYELDLDLENESKYANQWTQFDNQIKNQSTPISKKLKNPNFKTLIDSPLPKTIENGINRNTVIYLQENRVIEDETNKININTTNLNHEQNIILAKNKDDILKTECHVNTRITNCSLNNNNVNSYNGCKNIEISSDLFDDDFDEIFASNDILKSAINNCDKTKFVSPINYSIKDEINKNIVNSKQTHSSIKPKFPNENKNERSQIVTEIGISEIDNNYKKRICENIKYDSSAEKISINSQNDHLMSMIEIDKILEIVAEKEKAEKAEQNTKNSDLENFDLNDFLEPFGEETDWNENNYKENTKATNQKEAITRQLSDDIFDISSPHKVDQTKHITSIGNTSKEINDDAGLISPSLIGRRKPIYSQIKNKASEMKRTPTDHIKNLNKHSNKIPYAKSLFNISSDATAIGLKTHNKTAEESLILRPCRKLKNIIESSESGEEDDVCQLSQAIVITPTKTRALQRWNERKNKRKHCQFLNVEAAHSGNESSDDETYNEIDMIDSIVAMDSEEEEDDPNVNMHAKYLQSIRSPKHLARGAFKIPPQRKFFDLSRILSQPVQPDDTYKNCSFVVSDDEVFDGEVTEICPLEQAEAILKAKRKAKRKHLSVYSNKRRRIINDIIEISDDDDD